MKVAALFLCFTAISVSASDHFLTKTFSKEELTGSIGCVNGTLSLIPEFVEKVKQCLPGLSDYYGTKAGQKQPNCSLFCQGHAINTLGGDDLPNNELYNAFIDISVPQTHQQKVTAQVRECFALHGSQVNTEDAECTGAGMFNSCVFKVFELSC